MKYFMFIIGTWFLIKYIAYFNMFKLNSLLHVERAQLTFLECSTVFAFNDNTRL